MARHVSMACLASMVCVSPCFPFLLVAAGRSVRTRASVYTGSRSLPLPHRPNLFLHLADPDSLTPPLAYVGPYRDRLPASKRVQVPVTNRQYGGKKQVVKASVFSFSKVTLSHLQVLLFCGLALLVILTQCQRVIFKDIADLLPTFVFAAGFTFSS